MEVSLPTLVELKEEEDDLKELTTQMMSVQKIFERDGRKLLKIGQALEMYKECVSICTEQLQELNATIHARNKQETVDSLVSYKSEKQFDLRVLITVMWVFHRTSGGLPFVEFLKQGEQDVETNVLCILSESGMRRIPEVYGKAFKNPKAITKPLMTQRLFARLRKLKTMDGKKYSYLFPYIHENSTTIVIPLGALVPYLRQEQELMRQGQSLLRPEIVADPSSYVEPEIDFESKTENQIKVDVAKRLGLIGPRKRSVLDMEEPDLSKLEFAMKRRNYGYRPATDVKLMDPAFQTAAACIAGSDATGVAYEGHWTYQWVKDPDNHVIYTYKEVGSKRALPKKAAGARKKARKE